MIIILTCLLGFFFAYERKISSYILVFLFSLFLMPLLIYMVEPQWFQYRGYVPVFLIGILFVCHANILFRNKEFKINITFLGTLICLFFLILLICSIVNNYKLLTAISYFRNYFWSFLLYIVLVSLGYRNLKTRQFVELLMLIQIAVVILQYLGGESFSKSMYFWEMVKDGKRVLLSSESLKIVKGTLISGTMGKTTILGNTMSICLTYWIGSKLCDKELFRIRDYIFIILSFIVIISTGTRASLMTCMIGLLLSFIFVTGHFNKILSKIVIVSVLAILIMPYFVSLGYEFIHSGANYGENFNRSMTLFGVLGNLFEGDESAHLYTLQRSINISKFFHLESLLWGTGIYMNDPRGYGSGIASLSDVQLMFIIVEFGIIVFSLCLMPHLFCLRDIKKTGNSGAMRMCVILFIVILLQTIVDDGIFNSSLPYLLFLIYASEGVNYTNQITSETQNQTIC